MRFFQQIASEQAPLPSLSTQLVEGLGRVESCRRALPEAGRADRLGRKLLSGSGPTAAERADNSFADAWHAILTARSERPAIVRRSAPTRPAKLRLAARETGEPSLLSAHQPLGHHKPGVAGRVAFDQAKLVPALAPVETGRLE